MAMRWFLVGLAMALPDVGAPTRAPAAAGATPPAGISPTNNALASSHGVGASAPYGYPSQYFADVWRQRQQAMAEGNYNRAVAAVRELVDARYRSGWPDLPVLGEALAWESHQVGTSGDWKRALELANDAFELAPHRLAIHRAIAAARWGSGDMLGSFTALANALLLVLNEPPLLWARVSSLGLMIALGVIGAVVAMVMAGLYRNVSALLHVIGEHALPRGASPWVPAVVIAVILLLPALLCLGAMWTTLVWVAVLGPFLRASERRGATLALALLLMACALLPTLLSSLAYSGSRADDLYQALRDVGPDATTGDVYRPEARLLEHEQRGDIKPIEWHALGLRARWSGDARKAVAYLEKARQAGDNLTELQIALANARFFAGDPLAAVADYQQLLQNEPRNLLALFNLSQIYMNVADPKADDMRKKASEVNMRAVAKLAAYAQHTGLTVVEPEVPRALLAMPVETDGEHERAVDQVWRFFGGPLPRWLFAPVAVLVLIWLWWVQGQQRSRRWPRACERCGEPACMVCHPEIPHTSLCHGCFTAFERQGPQQLRIKKEIDCHRFHARTVSTQRLFNILMAGGGQLLRGEWIRGLLFAIAFLSGMMGLFSGLTMLPDSGGAYGGPAGLFRVLGGVLFALVYIVAILDGQRDRA